MECCLLTFDSDNRVLPRKSTVYVEQYDGKNMLLQKLGCSSTKYSLYVLPHSSLWAGVVRSQLSTLSHNVPHTEEIGSLLFKGGRHYSLVLVANGEEQSVLERMNEVVEDKVDYSTPESCSGNNNLNESGYLTYSSTLTTPTTNDDDDVIMMSSSRHSTKECLAQDESICTIIISNSDEEECEDPLSINPASSTSRTRQCALPGLFSLRLHPLLSRDKCNHDKCSASSFNRLPEKRLTKVDVDPFPPDKNASRHRQQIHKPLRDEVIVISSSDEATKVRSRTATSRQKSGDSVLLSRDTCQSSDEGIVLDSLSDESNTCILNESGQGTKIGACVTEIKGDCQSRCGTFSDRGCQDGISLKTQPGAGGQTSMAVKCCGYELSEADLKTLQPHHWLNDQIINCYMKLLVETYGHRNRVHIMSTFFYTKLSKTGYTGVERWIKKLNLKKLRLLLVPVHLSMSHWSLAAVDFRTKSITYFDSLQIRSPSCLKKLKMFLLKCAVNHKCCRVFLWKLRYAKGIPLQHNGNDCGVFVCQFAKWLCSRYVVKRKSRSHSDIPFQQRDIPRIRRTMLDELKTGVCKSF